MDSLQNVQIMRVYKIQWGKYLLFRWIAVSWILQAVHVLDRGERIFRILLELILLLPAIVIYNSSLKFYTFSYVIAIQSLFYFINSTWLVGYREVNKKFQGKGIESIIDFSKYVKKDLTNCEFNAALIYGSLSRKKYHSRSDLDIRIVKSSAGNIKLYFKAIKYRALGTWKYKIPVDLKVVSGMDYLKSEMRNDERPIVICRKEGFSIFNEGVPFEVLEKFQNQFVL